MGGKIAVCGHFGGEIDCGVERHPRFGTSGILNAPIAPQASRFGGDGYLIADGLNKLNATVYAVGAIGDDAVGNELYSHISALGIDPQYLLKQDGVPTSQMLYLSDKNGIIHSYVYDTAPETKEQVARFSPFGHAGLDQVVVASLNPSIREAIFTDPRQPDASLLWYAQGHLSDIDPDKLLGYIRRTKYLIMGLHEARYFRNALGFSSIDSFLAEGPLAVVVIEYEPPKSCYVYSVFTSVELSTRHFASLNGFSACRYRDVMIGFVIGFSYASYEVRGDLEVMLRIGIACSAEYLAHMDDPSYELTYRKITKRGAA